MPSHHFVPTAVCAASVARIGSLACARANGARVVARMITTITTAAP